MAELHQVKLGNGTYDAVTKPYVDEKLADKQDTLVSGTNIKTVNGESLLGTGNIPAGAPTGGLTDQILAKASNTDGDFKWVDDEGANLMKEECQYGSHKETREVEYYTWDDTARLSFTARQMVPGQAGSYYPEKLTATGTENANSVMSILQLNADKYRLSLNGEAVSLNLASKTTRDGYEWIDTAGSTSLRFRWKTGVNDKDIEIVSRNGYPSTASASMAELAYPTVTRGVFQQYARHTRTEEVDVPDYIHNLTCVVLNDLKISGKANPTDWGVAKAGRLRFNFTAQQEISDLWVDISELGLLSAEDYEVQLTVTGGGTMDWGASELFVWEKRTTQFGVTCRNITSANKDYTIVDYVVVARGYGNNTPGGPGGTVDQTYDPTSTNAQSGTAVAEAVGDLSSLTTTDKTSAVGAINELDAAVKGLGEPFRVKQWGSSTLNVEIPYCTEDIANGSIPKIVFSIDDVEGADYQIVGMVAYEVFDAASGGNRINCWPVCQFTGNGQKELSVRWMCGGTTRKTAKRINAWVLLKHR